MKIDLEKNPEFKKYTLLCSFYNKESKCHVVLLKRKDDPVYAYAAMTNNGEDYSRPEVTQMKISQVNARFHFKNMVHGAKIVGQPLMII